jgi:signal transduction histidine kinase
MIRTFMIGTALTAVLALPIAASAQQGQFGTASEARAMLDKAVLAVKADKPKALATFNSGEGGFLDRDLYPFCFDAGAGTFVAVGPNAKRLLGTDVRSLKDPTGNAYGQDLFAVAQKPDGQIVDVSYMFTRPGAEQAQVPKVTFVTRTGDLVCGVGYYK